MKSLREIRPSFGRLAQTGMITLLFAATGLTVAPAVQANQGGDQGVEVAILKPDPFAPVFGSVELLISVECDEPIELVEVFVDGAKVADIKRPPYQVTVDVGNENTGHSFRAVAHTDTGHRGEMALDTPAIQVDEEVDIALQQLYVTVTRGDRRVAGLSQADFRVIDNNRQQELVTFEGGDAPLTAVLLVDSSQSMQGGRLDAALDGAQAFLAGMRDLDEAKVILFSDRLLRASPFSGDAAEHQNSLAGVEASGGTALNDHLFTAFKLLDGRQGRRVVVLLSDGSDVHSVLGMKEVLWKARRSQALVYWIQLQEHGDAPRGFTSAWRNAEATAEELAMLETTVEESGGRVETIRSVEEVGLAFSSILRELREQYVLGYYPTNLTKDGSWRPVQVRARGGNQVRVREGYVDF